MARESRNTEVAVAVQESNTDSSTDQREEGSMAGVKRLLVCFFGVFFSYLIYGLSQERIAKTKFGEEQEQFKFFGFLVLCQCIINTAMATLACRLTRVQPSLRPAGLYGLLSCSYMGSMLASNTSLAFISFPMQVLGKSCKPIPVLLLGVLLGKKRYHISKFFNVFLIVAGVALFMFIKKGDKKGSDDVELSFGIGEILLLVSLTLDGITGALQDRLKATTKLTSYGLMFSVNVWSVFILGIGLFIFSDQYSQALAFIGRHPEAIYYVVEFGIMSAVGQIFIYQTIAHFGPLTCSIITTTRKFFTILASVVIFGHTLITRQWLGMCLVFAGLAFDVYFSHRNKMAADKLNGVDKATSLNSVTEPSRDPSLSRNSKEKPV